MKKTIAALAFWMTTLGAFAQGQVNFSNLPFFIDGHSATEPAVYDIDGTTRLAGNAFLAQLYWSATSFTGTSGGTALTTAPVPFFTVADGAPGFFDGGAATVGVSAGSAVFVQVRAWNAAAGATFAAAAANSAIGKIGASQVLALTAGGGTVTPPNLVGLQKFGFMIPEPSTLALGLLGAGVLLLRRRN